MSKLFVLVLCAALGGAAGYAVMRSYRRELLYIEGVCGMIGELKRNISYRCDSVARILGGLQPESDRLAKNIAEYIAYTQKKDGNPSLSRGTTDRHIFKKVCELFGSLGSGDGGAQLKALDAFGAEFDSLKLKAAVKYEKYGALAVKLGFLFGLAVGVLFL